MKVINYTCDGCGCRIVSLPMALIEAQWGELVYRPGSDLTTCEAHACSRECAELVHAQWSVDRTTPESHVKRNVRGEVMA